MEAASISQVKAHILAMVQVMNEIAELQEDLKAKQEVLKEQFDLKPAISKKVATMIVKGSDKKVKEENDLIHDLYQAITGG